MLISEWEVSTRTRTCLINAGYKEVEEIRDLRDEDILAIKNLNELCLSEIKQALSKLERKNYNNSPDMMELFGNNLAGQMAGASNESIEIALEKLRSNPQRQAYRLEVFETIRVRLSQGAHILIPGTTSGNKQFVYGIWKHNYDHTAWFIGFTSRKVREVEAGKDILQMPFEGFLESLLGIDGIEGIVLNPGKGGSYMIDKAMIKNLIATTKNPTKRLMYSIGDITKMDMECIVNAANHSLLGGGGVDGAIHRAAGFRLLQECRTLGGCSTGEAKITKGYDLKADYIIHTVGPVYSGTDEDAGLLAGCYRNSLNLAKNNGIHSIAFPAISTGIYGYPILEAAKIATAEVEKWLQENLMYPMIVCFVSYDKNTDRVYRGAKENC